MSGVMLALAIVLVAAALGGDLASRLGQPAVLGELVAGIVLGNLGLLGVHDLAFVARDPTVDALARIGALILLFQVGLGATVAQMRRIGMVALSVAALGVTGSFALGWLAGAWLLPGSSAAAHVFLGATLCATSVGISARVLKDLGRSESGEARIIVGAAVIDDVLSLVVLAVVTSVLTMAGTGSRVGVGVIVLAVGKSAMFLVGALGVGGWTAPRLLRAASRLQSRGALLITALAFCFALSWLAAAAGLAPIVGAFAAGLVLEPEHAALFTERGERGLEDLLAPLGGFLVPVFFVLMGMRADLGALAQPGVLALAAALTVAAVLGKQACALGVRGWGVNRLAIGVGMIPRGEVQLIFAGIGLGLTSAGAPVVSAATYSALVVVVVATTMMTPPALKWALRRR